MFLADAKGDLSGLARAGTANPKVSERLTQLGVKAAAETFRANPKLRIDRAITELAVREALVSLLDANGTPGMVERALIYPPRSQFAPRRPRSAGR